MYTIGQLVKQFAISRSSLIYYDRIGLLKPSARSNSNYRLYTEADRQRMQQIELYKEAGLSLQEIADLLDGSSDKPTVILESRLEHLNREISQLRQQQQLIVELLGNASQLCKSRVMDKAQWVKILSASGLDEAAMRRWHIEFERDMPEAHQDFLESLGIETAEIAEIRSWSQQGIAQ